jgi:hypothetical protein
MAWSAPRGTALAGTVLLAAAFASGVDPQVDTAPIKATDQLSRHRTATGTMTGYDPESRVLTIRSAAGSTAYCVAPDARAWRGRRSLPLPQLPSHVGEQATVAWAEVDGVRTTHTVRLDEPHAARAK